MKQSNNRGHFRGRSNGAVRRNNNSSFFSGISINTPMDSNGPCGKIRGNAFQIMEKYLSASKDALSQKYLPDYLKIMMLRYDCMKELLNKNGVFNETAATQCANMHIKHITAGFVRLCSEKCSESTMQKLLCIKHVFADERSIEAKKLAKGYTKQEKICNFMFKMNCSILELIFAKIIYLSQTRSKTLFDKMK